MIPGKDARCCNMSLCIGKGGHDQREGAEDRQLPRGDPARGSGGPPAHPG